MSLIDQINGRLKDAMRAKDAGLLSALRMIKAEIGKQELGQPEPVNEAQEQELLKRMAKQRRDSIEQFRAGARHDLADKEEAELKVIEGFLPAAIAPEALEAIVGEAIAAAGAAPNAGKLTGEVIRRVQATGLSFDGKAVGKMIQDRLKGA